MISSQPRAASFDPAVGVLAVHWRLAALDFDAKMLRFRLALKANFDPNQPRVPAGRPDGGQWTRVEGYVRDTIVEEPEQESSDARERRRRMFVLRGRGTRFRIAPNPNADPSAPVHAVDAFSDVSKHNAEIEIVAAETLVDADLIRAIMYVETTQGYYGRVADSLRISNSVLPMNINVSVWGEAFGGRTKLNVPLNNIRAGAVILRGIIGNLFDTAGVAEIATLYNYLPATIVSDYGARVQAVYNSRPWEK